MPERVRDLAALHRRAKLGALGAEELDAYLAERGRLVRVLLARQSAESGHPGRRSLRVACALDASVAFGSGQARGTTTDVSTGGLGVLLDVQPPAGSEGAVAISVPGGSPIRGGARVIHVRRDGDRFRVGLAFEAMDPRDAERLDLFVFDALLEMLGS